MEIVLGKTAGFCYGVRNAVQKAEEKLKKHKKLSCLGELVHNGHVIRKLEKLGLKIVERIEDSNNKIIIRAHGIAKEIYNKAKKLNIEVFDYTCPNVLKIHTIADEYSSKGYFVFLIGGKSHPESLGTISFCGKDSYLIEKEEEIDEAIKIFKKSNIKKLLIIVQTTFSLDKFNRFVEQIKQKIGENIELEVKNTICNATKIRQEETCEISKKVQCMIIIGGRNSSNTKKLFDIAKENCKNTIIVETEDELDAKFIKQFEKIGIMAGASTPDDSIQGVINVIEN
ncbi:MAG: 4-hydroxy-3-methylbut-2-enyl diphosphate reductase [Clostridia bacterium]|nr:4-hydroxy-3-methylbut-2-enyl diphosphate reductase [Clostridia bacterium]